MLKQIIKQFEEEKRVSLHSKFVLAVSGGRDSMVLLHLFQQLSFPFLVAHCNFSLRGEESDADEKFIKDYCLQHKIPFYTKRFETKEFAKKGKCSTQEAARILRYQWFEEIRFEKKFDFIATAHHLQDNIETLLLKLVNGTGVKGIRGILPIHAYLIRPLLNFPYADILNYQQKYQIPFREDASNAETYYDRNFVRQKVIPPLYELQNQLDPIMQQHFQRWQSIEDSYFYLISEKENELFSSFTYGKQTSIGKWKRYNAYPSIQFEILRKYGFDETQFNNLQAALLDSSSKFFFSKDFRLIKTRKHLIIQQNEQTNNENYFVIQSPKDQVLHFKNRQLKIRFIPIDKLSKFNQKSHHLYFDADLLQFPLIIRKWEEGDYFYPIGLYKKSGKASKKKISKFLKDNKVDVLKKENTLVLQSNKQIAALLNYRLDDRFKVSDKTKMVLHLKLNPTE